MKSITLVRRIAARPSIVFEAMTTPEGIASWWGPEETPVVRAESDPRVGGAYRVRFRAHGIEHEAFEEACDFGQAVWVDPMHVGVLFLCFSSE